MVDDINSSNDLKKLDFWRESWEAKKVPWHKDLVHGELSNFFDLLFPDAKTYPYEKSILFPLCGKTVDMAWCFNNKNINVYGIEAVDQCILEFFDEHNFLPVNNTKLEAGTEKYSFKKDVSELTIFKTDMFKSSNLIDNGVTQQVDAIFDRGSLTAILPDLRESYVNTLLRWLKPGGKILLEVPFHNEGVLFGPPHSVPEDQPKILFGKYGCQVDKLKSTKSLIRGEAEGELNLFVITKPTI